MSTQFDNQSNASGVRAIDQCATASNIINAVAESAPCVSATNWCLTASRHDHHQQQIVTPIAVHTPIHNPRGSSAESQSNLPYSNGSPQAGFHLPSTTYSTAPSPTTSHLYPHQFSFHSPTNSQKRDNEVASFTASYNIENGKNSNCALTNICLAEKKSNLNVEMEGTINNDSPLPIKSQSSTSTNNDSILYSITQQSTVDRELFSDEYHKRQDNCVELSIEISNTNNKEVEKLSNLVNNPTSDLSVKQQTNINENEQKYIANGDNNKKLNSTKSNGNNNDNIEDPAQQNIFIENIAEPSDNNNNSEENLSLSNKNNNINNFCNKNDITNGSENSKISEKGHQSESLNGNLVQSYNSIGNKQTGNRTFFRAPGLEAPDMSQISVSDSRIRVCPVCSFSCKSTFHYNSHMNTHSDHQCTMCNYTSRTEGRLRKHMRESHTHGERVRAGLEEAINNSKSLNNELKNNFVSGNKDKTISVSPLTLNTITTMSSIANIVNIAVAASTSSLLPTTSNTILSTPVCSSTSTAKQLMGIVDGVRNDSISTTSYSDMLAKINIDHLSSSNKGALEHIKALTDRASNPLTALNEILGISNQSNINSGNDSHEGVESQYPNDEDNDNNDGKHMLPSVSGLQNTQQPSARRSGRPKSYKCKQCPYISTNKEQSWTHNKTHIPREKQLTCSQCGFVTEYKHHLEYHMRNHKGSKPFKCKKCSYSCVNKSMLNSHMKSHTRLYQYRCKDCTYQTKYCHSLKMHLDKYQHTRMPGTIEMDSDSEEKLISEGDADDYGSVEDLEHHGKDSQLDDNSSTSLTLLNDKQNHEQQNSVSSLNSMLLQPIASSENIQTQYNDQIQQQYSSLRQLEQVNEMLRAANTTNTYSCAECEYVTTSDEESLRHRLVHFIAAQQPQQSRQSFLYQNLASVQQHQSSEIFIQNQQQQQQQQQDLNSVLGSTGAELINGILQPDSAAKELAAQLQQELIRAQALAQQQQEQQQQQHEETRRQAVAVAMATLANGSLSCSGSIAPTTSCALTPAMLNHSAKPTMEHDNNVIISSQICGQQHIAFAQNTQSHNLNDTQSLSMFASSNQLEGSIENGTCVTEAAATVHTLAAVNHFHSSTTTTATSSSYGFSHEEDDLQLAHSLSPICDGRRNSIGSASTSGGESFSKTCSISPGSEGHGGSRKRKPSKTIKVDQISVKLRDNTNNTKRHKSREDSGERRSKLNGSHAIPMSSSSDCGGLRTRSSTNGSGIGEESNFSSLLAQINRQNQMPHACQHCDIAFRDRALYQIHLGYHGYETPFKCNRCGHISDTSLEFNLHLYQAKHD